MSEYSPAAIAVTLILYCISGTLLTLANKLAIVAYPYANVLLIIQNGVTVILLLAGSIFFPKIFQTMPSINFQVFRTWFPLVVLFVTMLVSSLMALKDVSAVALIVMRNLSTLCVAFFEKLFLHEEIKPMTWCALIGILIGAVMFGARDLTFSLVGYLWIGVNVAATSAYQIYVKKLINQSKELGPFGMSYINNMVSLPMFLLISLANNELDHLNDLLEVGFFDILVIALSALLGFSLSTTAFMMNKMISATSMMVANNVNKFAVIILSEVFVERTLDDISTMGTVLVMFFGWFYSKTKSQGWTVKDILDGTYKLIFSTQSAARTGLEENNSNKV